MLKVTDVKNFVEGNLNKLYNERYDSLEKHIAEQAEWRAWLCSPCADLGHCVNCGCATPNMFYSTNKVDPQGKWGVMEDPETWERFKKLSSQYKEFAGLRDQLSLAEIRKQHKQNGDTTPKI